MYFENDLPIVEIQVHVKSPTKPVKFDFMDPLKKTKKKIINVYKKLKFIYTKFKTENLSDW